MKAATDLVDLVHSHFPLRRRGRHFEALCPFHEERTPSFKVSAEGQFFKCFGCGKGGDCFSFVEEVEHVSFREALEILAERAGVPLRSGSMAGAGGERGRMREALRFALDRFRANLSGPRGARARAYVEARGITPATATDFSLGYAADGWDDLLLAARAKGFAPEELERAGLVVRSEEDRVYDRFRDRLVFPIFDGLDRPVGFGARALGDEEKPKYLNSPETPLFAKGRLLYALERARTALATSDGEARTPLAVVEGYTDVLLAHQAGVRNVVATLGTALTPEHARGLRRYAETVILVFDADEAGTKASARGVEVLLAEDLDVRVALLPEGKDPCDFVRARGGEAFRAVLEGADDFFDYAMRRGEGREDLGTVAGKARVADALLSLVARVPSAVRRGEYVRRLASRLLVPEPDLRRRLQVLEARGRAPGSSDSPRRQEPPRDARRRAEEDCLRCCLQDPGALPAVRHAVSPEDFAEAAHAEIYRAMLSIQGRGEEIDGARLLLALAGSPARAAVAGWLDSPLERVPLALHGSLDYLQRARAEREAALDAEAFRRAREGSDPVAERGALERLHRRLREAKTLGR